MTESKINQIAKTCHEVNKAYCESIGDFSQPSWEDAPQWQKDSAKLGVQFHLDKPDSKPCDSHNSWMEAKIKDGWRFGAIKKPSLKEHPCLVPFELLPKEQQFKDALFIAVVRSFETKSETQTK